MIEENLKQFSESVTIELENNLIPFWLSKVLDIKNGGFVGLMSNDLIVNPTAPKGLILNTRLLWTYSALYRYNKDPRRRDMARRAYDYLQTCFWDNVHGGTFWQVDPEGHPLDRQKKIYGQAFYIYALSEYYLAFSEQKAFDRALEMFDLIETHSHDNTHSGYFEVCNQDWSIAQQARLSDKDMAEKKSMNNHLHILEAYTNLYRICPDNQLKIRLEELLDLFPKYIINPNSGHMDHFFDEQWTPKSRNYTFGHDIEASWLMCEAASVLADHSKISTTEKIALNLARLTLQQAVTPEGGLFYEGQDQHLTDTNKEWWPQAEAVVGFLNAHQISRENTFLEAARNMWDFITKFIVDHNHGDWFWRVNQAGCPDLNQPKVSQWKGPYHSVRACLETIHRLKEIAKQKSNKQQE